MAGDDGCRGRVVLTYTKRNGRRAPVKRAFRLPRGTERKVRCAWRSRLVALRKRSGNRLGIAVRTVDEAGRVALRRDDVRLTRPKRRPGCRGLPARGAPDACSARRLIAPRRASQRLARPPSSGRSRRAARAHRVADLAARPAPLDQPGAVEHGEVLDHGDAADGQLARQRRRRALAALGDQLEHAPAGRVRQRAEDLRGGRAGQAATRSAYSDAWLSICFQPPTLSSCCGRPARRWSRARRTRSRARAGGCRPPRG